MVFVSCRLCVWFILLKSVWLWYCLLESVWFLGGLGSWNNDVGFGYGVIVMVWVRLGIVGICWGCVFDDIMGIWGRCGFCVWDVVLCRLLLFNYDDCVGFWQLCDSVLFCCVSAGSTYSEQIRVFKKKKLNPWLVEKEIQFLLNFGANWGWTRLWTRWGCDSLQFGLDRFGVKNFGLIV